MAKTARRDNMCDLCCQIGHYKTECKNITTKIEKIKKD
jgi:hypothetical protein